MNNKLKSLSRITETSRSTLAFSTCGMWAAVSLFTFRPEAAHGLGVRIPNQDAEAIGRGNAFAATADDPAAIYYNPAGITQLPGFNFDIGDLNYIGINTHYESTNGAGANSKFHDISVPQLYLTYTPKELPISLGLGVYAPFGLATEYYDNSGFRSLAISAKLTYITLNPVIAWKPLDSLSIAAGPTVNWSRIDIKRGLITPSDTFQYTGEGIAYGANAGILWQPCQYVSFGANYRLPSTMHYSGTSSYSNPGFGPITARSGAAHTTADFQFPQIISGGISYRPTTNWNIEADVDWSDWHTLRTVGLDGSGSNPALSSLGIGDLALQLDWHGSWFYEFGVTRTFENGWFVSAGYFYSTETTSDQGFTPAVPDTDLHVASLGFGNKGEHFNWALAGQIIAGPKRAVAGSPPSNSLVPGDSANGSYQLFVPTLTVSAGYHF